MDVIEMLLDEACNDNIVLYGEDGEECEFEQVAVIPVGEKLYFILRPVDMEGLEDDEAFVFELVQTEDDATIDLVEDDETVDQVFALYYELLDDED